MSTHLRTKPEATPGTPAPLLSALTVCGLLLWSCAGSHAARPVEDEFFPVWSRADLRSIESFTPTQKIIGTHYFYWYDYPREHFFDDAARSDDALQDHFPDAASVSYRSLEWHAGELEDCAAAGIDFILPVYWGVVDNYFKTDVSFSVQGLGPLQAAAERRMRAGEPTPKIGLFYDTTTLLPAVRGEKREGRYDLRQEEGRDIFYRTIRDFFYQIHPRHWAAVAGRPLVVLYGSGFARGHDQSTVDAVHERFEKDFHGVRPYVVRDRSWSFRADAVTAWGAALSGPRIFDLVAQVGPGYNDTAVPGRTTPIRRREGGDFYRWSWNQVLEADVQMVLVETWNEMHEGTEICESVEHGRRYIELTREYGLRWKRGLGPPEEIQLQEPEPVPRPPSSEGEEYRDRSTVSVELGEPEGENGISLVRGVADGPVSQVRIGGSSCIQTPEAEHSYVYFAVADPFYFDLREPLVIEYSVWDDGHAWHMMQYDSHDPAAVLSGAYKDAGRVPCGKSGGWVAHRLEIEDARFVNRQNGGADFRLLVVDGRLAVRDVSVARTGGEP